MGKIPDIQTDLTKVHIVDRIAMKFGHHLLNGECVGVNTMRVSREEIDQLIALGLIGVGVYHINLFWEYEYKEITLSVLD